MSKREVTDKLILAALNAMEAVEDDYSDKELLSACFTITLRAMKVIMGRNENLRPACQEAAQMLLMTAADTSKPQ